MQVKCYRSIINIKMCNAFDIHTIFFAEYGIGFKIIVIK